MRENNTVSLREGVCSSPESFRESFETGRAHEPLREALILVTRAECPKIGDSDLFFSPEVMEKIVSKFLADENLYAEGLEFLKKHNVKFTGLRPGAELSKDVLESLHGVVPNLKNQSDWNPKGPIFGKSNLGELAEPENQIELPNWTEFLKSLGVSIEAVDVKLKTKGFEQYENEQELWAAWILGEIPIDFVQASLHDKSLRNTGIGNLISENAQVVLEKCFNDPKGDSVLWEAFNDKLITAENISDSQIFINNCFAHLGGGKLLWSAIANDLIKKGGIRDEQQFIKICQSQFPRFYSDIFDKVSEKGLLTQKRVQCFKSTTQGGDVRRGAVSLPALQDPHHREPAAGIHGGSANTAVFSASINHG